VSQPWQPPCVGREKGRVLTGVLGSPPPSANQPYTCTTPALQAVPAPGHHSGHSVQPASQPGAGRRGAGSQGPGCSRLLRCCDLPASACVGPAQPHAGLRAAGHRTHKPKVHCTAVCQLALCRCTCGWYEHWRGASAVSCSRGLHGAVQQVHPGPGFGENLKFGLVKAHCTWLSCCKCSLLQLPGRNGLGSVTRSYK